MVFGVGLSKEDISDCKGLRDIAMALPGFVLSGNSSVTLPYTRDKGALPWQPFLGLKLL